MTTMQCPCCGSKVDRKTPIVDLNTNSISFNGTIRLTPTEAEIVSVLAGSYGRFVSCSRILAGVYGAGAEPECATRSLSVHVHRIKQKIGAIGLRIEARTGHGGGRRMVAA